MWELGAKQQAAFEKIKVLVKVLGTSQAGLESELDVQEP